MPSWGPDLVNKLILFYSILFYSIGLELPCTYTFSGQAADVEKLRTLLKPTAFFFT